MRRLAIPAAIGFHITATIMIWIVGKFVSLPQLFPDTAKYQPQIVIATGVLRNMGFEAWFFALLPFHIKLYSLCFALFAPWSGFSILLIEPLNALYYVAILSLVYYLSRRLFGQQTALLATLIVAVWPTFLAHTTQPLKDPLFLVLALLFLTINCLWLVKQYSPARALAIATLGVVTECLLWIVKSDMWEVMIAIGVATCGTVIIKMLRARKITSGNIAGAVLLLVMSVIIPRIGVQLYQPALRWAEARGVAALYKDTDALANESDIRSAMTAAQQSSASPIARISRFRERFRRSYPGAGSNIDTDVKFSGTADIIRYLPRAALIGLFAPFPKMWFATGSQNGRMGRLIGGIETFALYIIEVMALIGFWQRRRQPSVWWLFVVSILGLTALGIVVTNIGALYRLRYIFVILLVMLGADGIRLTLRYFASARRQTAGQQLRQV
jgi:hypothetical protein